MIDDDDVNFVALAINPTTLPGFIIYFIVVIALLFVVYGNHVECEQMHCDHGKPALLKNECLCVESAHEQR